MSDEAVDADLRLAWGWLDADQLAHAVLALARHAAMAVFLVDCTRGRVEALNALARGAPDGEQERVLACARQPQACGCGCTVSPLARADGEASHQLVMRRAEPGLAQRLTRAASLWSLTDKQLEVLSLVAVGLANKEMAAKLQCAESTVEAHVTRLLARTGAAQRGVLIYLFWTET